MRAYLLELDSKKPVVLCGDLNVAHEEIDLKNPKNKPWKRRFFRRGAREADGITGCRIYRYLPVCKSRCDGRIYMVVLPVSGTQNKRRMADRLFSCIQTAQRQNC